jgi:hypothetical protein
MCNINYSAESGYNRAPPIEEIIILKIEEPKPEF